MLHLGRGASFSMSALYPDLYCVQINARHAAVCPNEWLANLAGRYAIMPWTSDSLPDVKVAEEFLRFLIVVLSDSTLTQSNVLQLRRELLCQLATSEVNCIHSLACAPLCSQCPAILNIIVWRCYLFFIVQRICFRSLALFAWHL